VFTGIVQQVGEVRRAEARDGAGGSDRRLEITCGSIARERLEPGASVAVDGVCLTVAALDAESFFVDASAETLRVTTLGARRAGDRVNLEAALRVGDALGGHWVSGHVDGIAEVLSTADEARSLRVELQAPVALARYIAKKGSVTLDGVSLTVNEVAGAKFSINLIPHTLAVTTLGGWRAGSRLNLEIDLLARYVERLASEPVARQ
jgi:riboflavin synthase